MPITTLDHPLAAHLLTRLRSRTTEPEQFRALCRQLTTILALEATRNLPTVELPIQTPMETAVGKALGQGLAVVPILRAGLGMLEAITDLFPDVAVGYIGLERDHHTAVASSYYCKLPPLDTRRVLLVDPMLATGGSAIQAVKLIRERTDNAIALLCIVAAPEGIRAVSTECPDVAIFTCAVDRELDARKYILPGLGDFGDRLYGT
jgi:uracil phosphoribosyltransferase